MRAIPNNNLGYPVFIKLKSGGAGSGFFLNTKKFMYLVTAKHVLFNLENGALLSNGVDLISYSTDPKAVFSNHMTLDLKALLSAGHLIKHKNRDVVIIRLAEFWQDNRTRPLIGVDYITMSNEGTVGVAITSLKSFDDVLVSNEVFLFGYPISLGLQNHPQLDMGKPLLRGGIVAGLNYAQRSIVLDCPSYPGNSGGPVIEVEVDEQGRRHFSIIGIMVQYVPYAINIIASNKINKIDSMVLNNSGYSIAEPIDFILELLGNDE